MKLEPRSRIAIPPMTLFVLLAIVAISSTVHGDRGGFSLNAEHVYESRQTAIIAWNGTEEVLMLSTDIGSSTGSDVVEIMPFPANPTISKGETSSFVKVKDLVNTYFYWQATRAAKQYASYSQGSRSEQDASSPAIEITFQQSIGIHYVTVVRTEEAPQLATWLKDFLSAEGYNFTLPATLDSLIENYTQNGLNFFVVDMLKTDSNVNTIEPLIYEFATSRLYYPLHISNLFSGNTDISLFTVTNEELKDDQILGKSLLKKAQFQIKQTTSADISSNVSKLFSSNPYLCYFTFAGELNSFNQDLLAQAQPKNPATKVVLATVSLLWGSVLLFLFLPSTLRPQLRGAKRPIIKHLQLASLTTGLVGLLLVLFGSNLPWGLAEYREATGLLLPISGVAMIPPNGVVSFLFTPLLFAAIACHFYLLANLGHSRSASLALLVTGTLMICVVIVSSAYLHALSEGFFIMLIGCIFTTLAGSLYFWHVNLTPTPPTIRGLQTYLTKAFLRSALTLAGITWIVFIIMYSFPPEMRMLFGF